jgi:hypothetical protein
MNFKMTGKVRFILTDIKTGKKTISNWIKNICPTAGRTAMARRLVNAAGKTNEAIITYGAVGTGTGTPANGDTILGSELDRNILTAASNSNNIATLTTFFGSTEANGALTEFGLFGEEATGSANTGTLFERVIISITKTSASTLTIESVITIS